MLSAITRSEDPAMCTDHLLTIPPASVATTAPAGADGQPFSARLLGLLNAGATTLLLSVGHRTGLFDQLADGEARTSAEIAHRARLQERYVREWLNGMTVAGIVGHDPVTRRYHLPAEHAACLSRRSPSDNLAAFAQYIPLLGAVEDRILGCFTDGGGLRYEDYGRFHAVMAEDSGQGVVPALLSHILPLADGLVRRLERGCDVLDVGCGAGRALLVLARHFPRSRFTGYDLCEEALALGAAQAAEEGLTNLRFVQRDATGLDHQHDFDLVTAFDAIHDQKEPALVLAHLRRALRPGGVFLMVDIAGWSRVERNHDHPLGPLLYTISLFHCMAVSLGQGGRGYGAMWGQDAAQALLAQAGFHDISIHRLAHDPQNAYFVCR
jgi:SAM-dependent methyltransferase